MNAPLVDMVLCGANLFGFAPALDQRQRNDWLHSNLLAQLAADRKFPQRASGWQAFYETNLARMAWVMLKSRANTARLAPSYDGTITSLLSAQLPGVLVESQRLMVENMLSRWETAHGSPCDQLLRRRMCHASAEPGIFNRLALTLSLVLSGKDALTLELDFDTSQTLAPNWLSMVLQPKHLQGEVSFRFSAWTFGDYEPIRALVDQRVSELSDSQIFPWYFQASLD